jgi:hypothetical protein
MINICICLGPGRAIAFFPGFENKTAGEEKAGNNYKDEKTVFFVTKHT